MRTRMLLIVGAGMAGLAGCDGGAVEVSETRRDEQGQGQVRVAGRLDCPEREGDLRLISAATDGRACAYRDEKGAEVELRLTGADGRAELAPLEAELRALVPAAAPSPEPPEPLPPKAPDASGASEEKARVRVPGVMDIKTEGDRASVRLPGIRVEANGDKADVRIGGRNGDDVSVRAHDGGAEIRTKDDDKGALTSTFLLASEEPGPAGWRVAGYQARGAASGPLVLGVVRARRERHNRLMDDLEDLVDRNVRN